MLIKKKIFTFGTILLFSLPFVLTACGNSSANLSSNKNTSNKLEYEDKEDTIDKEISQDKSDKNILIAYFTLADNYEDSTKMDATSQASLNPEKEELIGNTEYIARFIQQNVGGDMFSIQVQNPYPNDYDEIVDMGSDEQREDARPALATHVENIEQYDIIYLGFPIWWYTMPQALFTFLEEYDFSGKTIIPFATDGGYGVGSSVEDIKALCPDSNVVTDIFEAERDDNISSQQDKVTDWLNGLK